MDWEARHGKVVGFAEINPTTGRLVITITLPEHMKLVPTPEIQVDGF